MTSSDGSEPSLVSPPEAFVADAIETGKRVPLRIRAATPFTEVRVLDARLEPVPLTNNTGDVDLLLAPGVYEVSFRGAAEWESRPVLLTDETDEPKLVRQQFGPREATTDERPCAEALNGASLVVTIAGASEGSSLPLGAISVVLMRGDDTGAVEPDLNPQSPECWRFSAEPGHWRLRINEANPRQPFELPITLIPGYVTQVFAPLCHSSGDHAETAPIINLEQTRVRMLAEGGRTVAPELAQYEEAAIIGLRSGKPLFGSSLEEMIAELGRQDRLNPMLGLYAAHFCQLAGEGPSDFRHKLLAHLDALAGSGVVHPDVQILRLALRVQGGDTIEQDETIAFPPLLAASWQLLLDLARRHPWLVPQNSLCERIADRLWSSGLWVTWTAPPLVDAGKGPQAAPIPEAEWITKEQSISASETIFTELQHRGSREWLRAAAFATVAMPEDGTPWNDVSRITSAEFAVAASLFPLAPNEDEQPQFSSFAAEHEATYHTTGTVSLSGLAQSAGLPRATVARAVTSLAGKLHQQSSGFNVKS